MLKYTVKRLAQSLVTILLIATIVFLLMRCLPTDYYFTEEQLMKFTEEQKYAALEAAGLTDPIGTQLIHFYNDLLHLDFGTSRRIQNGATVVKVIGKKFGVSMRLGLISAGISLVVGVLMGIIQTAFKDKLLDWIGTAYTVFVNAVPSLVSYSLVLVFGSKYLGFPTLYSTRNVGPSSVLPIVCLSLASIAGYALWTRRYMVDELTRDYIKLVLLCHRRCIRIAMNYASISCLSSLSHYIHSVLCCFSAVYNNRQINLSCKFKLAFKPFLLNFSR